VVRPKTQYFANTYFVFLSEIAIYSEEDESEDHIYTYITPSDYITFTHVSQQNATDDDKYTSPYIHKKLGHKTLMTELQSKLQTEVTDVSNRDKVPRQMSVSNPERKQIPQRSISNPERRYADTLLYCRTPEYRQNPPELPPRQQTSVEECDSEVQDDSRSHLDLSISEFSDILKQLKLEKHVGSFKKNQVDGQIAGDLTDDILKDTFYMTRFEIMKFTKFVKTGHIPR